MSEDHPPPGAGAGQGPPPPPGGYGCPQPAPQNNPLAIVSLVLGIVGVCCGQLFVLSIGAIVTGYLGRQQVAASLGRQKGAGMALAGLVLGAVGIMVGIVYWVGIATGVIDTTFYVNRS